MFWADKIVRKAETTLRQKTQGGGTIVVRDEKTASGRMHLGSLRGVVVHGLVAEVLAEHRIPHRFIFEINDFDPMDGLPADLDQAVFAPHMGKPLCEVPSPHPAEAKNFAEFYGNEIQSVIEKLGFSAEFPRSSALYRAGRYNDLIRKALDNADTIRKIYKTISGSIKPDDWYPFSVICQSCGRVGTTRVFAWDGEKVSYRCEEKMVEWARGCGHEDSVPPFDGAGKMPWKVEWAAKFALFAVDIEGNGKDHSSRGGARDVADAIAREVFRISPPLHADYEWVLVGGKKMSSSKGVGASAMEVADLLPSHMVRFMLAYKNLQQTTDFIPDGNTIPVLYDTYDRYAERYFSGVEDDFARVFYLCHNPEERKALTKVFLPRFSQVAYLGQIPHIVMSVESEAMKGAPLSPAEERELTEREHVAKQWIDRYAPEEFRLTLQETLPKSVGKVSATMRDAMRELLSFIEGEKKLDGAMLHAKLHELRKTSGLDPVDFFRPFYQAFLGRSSGPKLGWFLSVLDREFLEQRLKEML